MGYSRAPLQQTGGDSGSRAGGAVCAARRNAGGNVFPHGSVGRAISIQRAVGDLFFAVLLRGKSCGVGAGGGSQDYGDGGKKYLFERIRTERKLSIPYVPYSRAVSCLSTVCFLATGIYRDEREFLQLSDKTEDEIRTEIIHNLFYHEEEEKRYSYSDELKWLGAIERGELENPDDVDLTSMFEHLYRVGVLTIQGDLKQAEYMMVVAITLASRAAIRGGADPFMAYQVSDVYLQKLSGCDNLRDMGKTGLEGVSAFNTLVRQHLESVGGNPYCEKTKTYVVRHIREKIRMKDIAEHVGLSGSYLASLFQKEEGISIKQYIMQERLSLATNLLKNTDESIGTISDYLAFNSQSYFTSHFRERYGMTPTEYRQKYTKLAM